MGIGQHNNKVIVAMSGGVDSSVAAFLLKQAGYDVVGVTMRLWTLENPEAPPHHRRCCSVEDVEDARRVCQMIGVPHYIMNLEREFQSHVVDYFCREYGSGRTPNPCLACNEKVKFDFLLRKALALGADYIATGHYARIDASNGTHRLLKAADASKDQTYVLYTLGQRELEHLLFPVGQYCKVEARHIAQSLGLPVAQKADSQEICFITQGDYRDFIAQRLPPNAGDIVDTDGNILGRHPGVECFTIGQRRGLGVNIGKRLFVIALDSKNNMVIVGGEEKLFALALRANMVTYVSEKEPHGAVNITAKIRYKSPEVEAVLFPDAGQAEVRFASPQRAVTPGQAVVFYQGEEVIGGGIIEATAN